MLNIVCKTTCFNFLPQTNHNYTADTIFYPQRKYSPWRSMDQENKISCLTVAEQSVINQGCQREDRFRGDKMQTAGGSEGWQRCLIWKHAE